MFSWRPFISLYLPNPCSLTHWPLENFNLILDFQANVNEWCLRYLLRNRPQLNATKPYWWKVSIGSGNGLVPSVWPRSMSPNGVTKPQWWNTYVSITWYQDEHWGCIQCSIVHIMMQKNLAPNTMEHILGPFHWQALTQQASWVGHG